MRLIDADKIDTRERGNNSQRTMWWNIKRIIDAAPTVHIKDEYDRGFSEGWRAAKEEFKKPEGEWLDQMEPFGPYSEVNVACCSNCHESYVLLEYGFDDLIGTYKYCPNCGAKMKNGGT